MFSYNNFSKFSALGYLTILQIENAIFIDWLYFSNQMVLN